MDRKDVGTGEGSVGRLILYEMRKQGLTPLNSTGEVTEDFRLFAIHFPQVREADEIMLKNLIGGRLPFVSEDDLPFVAWALRGFSKDPSYTSEYLEHLQQDSNCSNHCHEANGS